MDTIRENLLELTDSSLGTNGYVRIVGADGSSYRMAIQDFIDLCAENESIGELIKRSSVHIGTTTTGPEVSEKIVACDDFEAIDGAVVAVTFSQRNTADDAKLNINGTGAHAIYATGGDSGTEWLRAVGTYLFVYRSTSGGRYRLVGAVERIPSDDMPLMDATAGAAGTSLEYSRADHVHPRDTGLVEAIEDESQARAEADTALDERVDAAEDDISELKADLTDLESSGTVPNADALLSDEYVTESVPYLYRQTGGGIDGAGSRELDEIVGGSCVRNQLARYTGRRGTLPCWGATDAIVASETDTSITIQNVGNVNYWMGESISKHKVFFSADITQQGASANALQINFGGRIVSSGVTLAENTKAHVEILTEWKGTADGSSYNDLYVYPNGASGAYVAPYTIANMQIIDITALLGSTIADYIYSLEQATAGAGIAKLREWGYLTDEYIPYDAGTIKSVEGLQSHDMVGLNQYDPSTTNVLNCCIDRNSGTLVRSEGHTCVYIPCLPSTIYTASRTRKSTNERFGIGWTEEVPKAGVPCEGISTQSTSGTIGQLMTVHTTTGANAKYLVVWAYWSTSGTDPLSDFQINFTGSGENDDVYEPYVKHSYPLDSSLTLRGVPKLDASNNLYYDGDTYASDGTVTRRYGVVDLGTLSWTNSSSRMLSSNGLSGAPAENVGTSGIPKAICARYTAEKWSSINADNDKTIGVTGNQVMVMDSAYTNSAEFKAAMSGVYLIYKLATPTTETATPYTNPQICDKYGTEEYVTTGVVPVGHSTKYLADLKAKIEGLPWDLSMIAPIETGTTASQAYAVGEYFLLDNKFCKAKTAIASGATFTLNTNYEVTTVADELYTALH